MEFDGIIGKIVERAKLNKKKIVLPESNDIRVLKAAKIIADNDIANIILIGSTDQIEFLCKSNDIDMDFSKITICNPETSDKRDYYINSLFELRKHKGISMPEVIDMINDNVYFGTMMLKLKDADGLVCGAIHATADTLRPAFEIIKTADDVDSASSFFIMEVENTKLDNKLYIFSDCGVIKEPTSKQLSDIAISSAKSCREILEIEPNVAFLSYSPLGSAKSEEIDKVKNAVEIVKEKNVDFKFDGEMQVDAALVPSVAKLKAPLSDIQGTANVLVFPNLEAGNIGYKLVQRFTSGVAIGPITQGLARPVNDLSRGCDVKEIIATVAVTSIQASMKGE